MRKILSTLIILLAVAGLRAGAADTLFPYPVPPENLTTLGERTSYIVEHFWDRANLKSMFSSMQKLSEATGDYFSFMPYADAEVVHASIDKLLKDVGRNPKHLLALAEIAEAKLYSDTAELVSDEIYLPFAKAVAENKKISAAEKARFVYQAKVLGGSQVGMTAPDFTLIAPDGTTRQFRDAARGANTLIFVNDPECEDCALARARLAADININELIDRGLLRIVSVYPDEPTDEWRADAATYNPKWIVGAVPDFDQAYDMRYQPVLYYLDRRGRILSKTLLVANLLEAFRVANQRTKAEAAAAQSPITPAPQTDAQPQ